jgi:O-antigen/teichoic acid export membrane protein
VLGVGRSLAIVAPRILLRLNSDPLLRNSAIYLGGSIAAGAMGYVFHFSTGRLLGPTGYAVVASVLSALYLVSLPGIVLQTVAMRFTSTFAGRGEHGATPRLIAQLTVVSLVTGGLGAMALLAVAPAAAGYLKVADLRVVYALAVAAVLTMLIAANRGVLQGLQRFVALSANFLVDTVSRVIVAASLILAGLGALGGVIAIVVGPALAYGQSLVLLRSTRMSERSGGAGLRDLGRYAVWASAGAMGVTFLFNADVILAKHYLPDHAAGIYASGSVLGRVIYFLGVTVSAVMFPEVAALHARNEDHYHIVDKSLMLLGGLAVGLIVIYFLFPGQVVVPFGSQFAGVASFLGPFAIALSLLALSNLLINYFLSVNSRRFVIPLLGACALETGLIVRFHAGPAQILTMVVLTMVALTAALASLYGAERFSIARSIT